MEVDAFCHGDRWLAVWNEFMTFDDIGLAKQCHLLNTLTRLVDDYYTTDEVDTHQALVDSRAS